MVTLNDIAQANEQTFHEWSADLNAPVDITSTTTKADLYDYRVGAYEAVKAIIDAARNSKTLEMALINYIDAFVAYKNTEMTLGNTLRDTMIATNDGKIISPASAIHDIQFLPDMFDAIRKRASHKPLILDELRELVDNQPDNSGKFHHKTGAVALIKKAKEENNPVLATQLLNFVNAIVADREASKTLAYQLEASDSLKTTRAKDNLDGADLCLAIVSFGAMNSLRNWLGKDPSLLSSIKIAR